MSLYRKHRPQSLEEMIGSSVTISKLESWAKNSKRSHSILLTGQSGCGKTTAARIMAGLVGCEGGDYTEMDTADFRGIDSIRELRSKVNYLPMESKARVYLLDECHKLTNDAQNALLKILEEPPEHVYLILATTNPEKLIKTIKTRCTVFTFDPLSVPDTKKLLKLICKKEKVKVQDKTLAAIADKADGSPRKALSSLEQILKLDDPDVEITDIEDTEKQVIDLCRALIRKKPWKEITAIIKALTAEPETCRQSILGYCNACLLNGDQKAYLIMEPFLQHPFYDAGKARLTACCFEALYAEE